MKNVTQLINSRGNPAANHFVITCDDGSQILKSYNSLVAKVDNDGKVTFGPHWDYSATTLKHVKTFIGSSLSKADLQKRIDSGDITEASITIE